MGPVVDNVAQEAVSFLREHFPRKNASGNILLTTRTRDIAQAVTAVAGQQHEVVELRAPDLQCAALLLLREAGIDTNDTDPATTNRAETLVKCVGCLPLAVSHAASFAQQEIRRCNIFIPEQTQIRSMFFVSLHISSCLIFANLNSC
jgi:hypothetical protein